MTILGRIWSFSKMNIAASVLLFLSAILAAIVANSPMSAAYQNFLMHELSFQIGDFNLLSHGGHPLKMIEFINDGLMTIFFLMVGLEIKREVLVGELSTVRKALLPFIAACGGMVLPMLVYAFFCKPGTIEGAGITIPMATDIAFSLGVLSLLGSRVPVSLKIFLTAFAVVDDIGGILVIAIFYSSHISYIYLIIAAIMFVMMYFLSKNYHLNKIFIMVVGFIIWYLFMQSGIHSTIAGVILAFVIRPYPRLDVGKYIEEIRQTIAHFPVMKEDNIILSKEQIEKLGEVAYASQQVISPLQALEDNIKGAVNYLILPLFAFVNAGVVLSGDGELIGSVGLGVGLGLILGKFIGIYSFTWLSVKTKLTPMPKGMTWKNLAGVAMLGGIGFTVSLFIANLSFGATAPELLNEAKFGVLAGSIVSGILGYILLRLFLKKEAHDIP